MSDYLAGFEAYKRNRDQAAVQKALDGLARACNTEGYNTYQHVIRCALAGVTHGEICGQVRKEMGFGQPLVVA